MLPPEYLDELPEPILALYEEAERDILADMARRISTYDYWIPAADWQNQKLLEAGRTQEEILRILSRITRRSVKELKTLMEQAEKDGLRADKSYYEAAGRSVPSFSDSEPLRAILNAGYQATAQTMKNLTRTTARTATQQFENALDEAWMKIESGGFSTDVAVRDAVKRLAAEGVQSVRYPSGRSDTLEVAVRRAVVTGVNQTAGKLQMELADELDCDLMELTAHEGARPSHALWQGKIVSLSGREGYLSLQDIGYGTGAGFQGWNCRHNWSPYIEGMPRAWTEEKLAKLNEKKYTYNGEKLTEYEAQQKQRYIERQIRRWKREEAAMKAAGLDSSEASAKVRQWQGIMRDFLKQTGLKRRSAREQIEAAAVAPKAVPDVKSQTDVYIGRSVGAKSRNYEIVDKESGLIYHFAEGTHIQNVEVFAGAGVRTPLHEGVAEGLAKEFGGKPSDWQHVKGFGKLSLSEYESRMAEVHWFQAKDVGKVKFFLKRWVEE